MTGTYLLNPEDTNGVATYRNNPGEEIMSIADQYLYRAGGTWFPTARLGFSVGGRWEGIPTHDLLGDSNGVRRRRHPRGVHPPVLKPAPRPG